jgi:hypothetical protein
MKPAGACERGTKRNMFVKHAPRGPFEELSAEVPKTGWSVEGRVADCYELDLTPCTRRAKGPGDKLEAEGRARISKDE